MISRNTSSTTSTPPHAEGFALPIGSRLLTTAVGLVTLHLVMVHPSTYFHPNTLLQWISFHAPAGDAHDSLLNSLFPTAM
jgi:hypothetical protein